jgi:hypothetical protein
MLTVREVEEEGIDSAIKKEDQRERRERREKGRRGRSRRKNDVIRRMGGGR